MNVAVVVIAVAGRRVLYQGVRPAAAGAAVEAGVVVGPAVLVRLLLLLELPHTDVPRLIPGLAPGRETSLGLNKQTNEIPVSRRMLQSY